MNLLNEMGWFLAANGERWNHGDWWFIGPMIGLLWWGLIATAVFFFARRGGWGRTSSGAERARDILAERFARGELTADEYQERLANLA